MPAVRDGNTSGCPVVSTDCPSGPRETLAAGERGRLVPMRDARALASGMLATLEAPPARDRLRARGREYHVDRIVGAYARAMRLGNMPASS